LSGAILLFPLYAFVGWTGSALYLAGCTVVTQVPEFDIILSYYERNVDVYWVTG